MRTLPIDIVTHEGFHLVQGYGYSAGPVWLTEGIADFIRYEYGVDNIGSKWYLPAFKETQSYKNSYRVTARFFEWIEQKVKPGMAVQLDKELRAHTYTEGTGQLYPVKPLMNFGPIMLRTLKYHFITAVKKEINLNHISKKARYIMHRAFLLFHA
ncbi:hypothetical protein HK413_07600 [Mucilaginibacter sp. S1162]|uniref:DUF1570 domain-containing protein n=1 Tax=Mucilaginibacter humi TaxID=2732510 RepID=A0ABX1W1D5_9SPHI|nr:basic secretory protein-like protein [Mucilaginibacter humi]NNU34052.1 hypothetical protein [Mucilaginibacter humi]